MGTWSAACWAPGTALASLSRPAPRRGPERSWRQGTAPWRSRPAAAPALGEGLEAEGWVCWQESLDAVPLDGEQSAASYSYGVLRQLGRAALNSAYVTLDDSRQTADVLPALLRQLNYREYVVSTPMETKL